MPHRLARGSVALHGFVVDSSRYLANLDGQPLALTPIEFLLLFTLLVHPGWAWTRQQLADILYNGGSFGRERAVDSHVKNLRRKCRAIRPGTIIRTIYGIGYALHVPESIINP